MDDTSYREWLGRYNVSKPHRTGRWRVLWGDTVTISMPPHVIAVADFDSFNPSPAEWEHFCRWRDSDERRHKLNAAGFLRFAIRRRRLVDGNGETQVRRIRGMARKIKEAMFLFANGNDVAGTELMCSAWGDYMMIFVLSQWGLAEKGARFSSGRRKGAKGSFTYLVEEAARAANTAGWKAVIQYMENATDLVDEVDWDNEKIWISGETKARSFKTVKNILATMN